MIYWKISEFLDWIILIRSIFVFDEKLLDCVFHVISTFLLNFKDHLLKSMKNINENKMSYLILFLIVSGRSPLFFFNFWTKSHI